MGHESERERCPWCFLRHRSAESHLPPVIRKRETYECDGDGEATVTHFYVQCQACMAQGPEVADRTEACALWNTVAALITRGIVT